MGSTTCLGLQSQTTRLNERTTQDDTSDESERDFNPLRSCVPADLNLQCVKWSSIKHLQFKYPLVKRKHPIQIGLCPLPSPVLGTSLLVSCPPLSDMLKFSGWSRLTEVVSNEASLFVFHDEERRWMPPPINQHWLPWWYDTDVCVDVGWSSVRRETWRVMRVSLRSISKATRSTTMNDSTFRQREGLLCY